MAASAVGAGAGTEVGQEAEYAGLGRTGTAFVASLVGGMAASAVDGGQGGTRQIVVNALGYAIVNGMSASSQGEADRQRQEDMRDAVMFNALGRVSSANESALGNVVGNSIASSQQTGVLGAAFAGDMAVRNAANPLLMADSDQIMTDNSQIDSHALELARLDGQATAELALRGALDQVPAKVIPMQDVAPSLINASLSVVREEPGSNGLVWNTGTVSYGVDLS